MFDDISEIARMKGVAIIHGAVRLEKMKNPLSPWAIGPYMWGLSNIARAFILPKITRPTFDVAFSLWVLIGVLCAGLTNFAPANAAALTIEGIETDVEHDAPLVCITFSSPIDRQPRVNFEDYIKLEPRVNLTFEALDRQLCLKGPVHGDSHTLTIKRGLPSRSGATLAQDRTVDIEIGDRKPQVTFRPGGYVLPQSGPRQLVVRTVNVREVKVRIMKIPDRGISPILGGRAFQPNMSPSEVEDLANRAGEEVFRGQLSILEAPNRAVETGLSLEEIFNNSGPGLFVALAERRGPKPTNAKNAAQWFVISDMGLMSLANRDGLTVAVRSLANGRPLAGVDLNLLARNNKELGRAITGPDGLARFDAAVMRGQGGNAPLSVIASNGESDFNILSLASAPLDLRDRGIDPQSRSDSAKTYLALSSDRVRPGSRIECLAITKDDQGKPVTGLPLTLTLTRPDGSPAQRITVTTSTQIAQGGFNLPANAMIGKWHIQAELGPKAISVAGTDFLVLDPRPRSLLAQVTAPDRVTPGREFSLSIAANYLGSGPAAGLTAQAELTLSPGQLVRTGHEGFHFGRNGESTLPRRIDLGSTVLAAKGDGRITARINSSDLPQTSRALSGILQVTIPDPDGRPNIIRRPVILDGGAISLGLKPQFSGGIIADQTSAVFDVIALDGSDHAIDRTGISYELVAEETDYQWQERDGAWTWREITKPRRIAGGPLAIKADGGGLITTPALPQGRYRVIVFEPNGSAETDFTFRAGSWSQASAGRSPDRINIVTTNDVKKPGDSARIKIIPTFESQILITIADSTIRETRLITAPPEGVEMDIKVPDDARGTLHILAAGFADTGKLKGAQAARAIGSGQIKVDDSQRRLNVSLNANLVDGRSTININLPNLAEGATASLYLRARYADDQALAKLRNEKAPDSWTPTGFFLGTGRAEIDVRDLYNDLADSRGVTRGQLRNWTDSAGGDVVAVPESAVVEQKRARVIDRAPLPTAGSVSNGIDLIPPVGFQTSRFIGPINVNARQIEQVMDLPEGPWIIEALVVDGEKLGDARIEHSVPAIASFKTPPSQLAPGDELALTLPAETKFEATGGDIRLDGQKVFVKAPQRPGLIEWLLLDSKQHVLDKGRIEIRFAKPAVSRIERSTIPPRRQAGTPASLTSGWSAADLDGGIRDLDLFAGAALHWPGLLRQAGLPAFDTLELILSFTPAIVTGDLNRLPGFDSSEAGKARMAESIARLLETQRADGGFDLGAGADESDDFITALTLDMLVRARDRGLPVALPALERGFKRLSQILASDKPAAARAYALYVLARIRAVELAEAQNFADSPGNRLSNPLARAQTAAALMILGDRDRARRVFAGKDDVVATIKYTRDNATPLWNLAGALALGAEHRILRNDEWQPLADDVAGMAERAASLSLEDRIFLSLASGPLIHRGGTILVSIDGKIEAETDQPLFRSRVIEGDQSALLVENRGLKPIQRLDAITADVKGDKPIAAPGFSIRKTLVGLDGRPVDLNHIRTGDLILVLLDGELRAGTGHGLVSLSDPIPAGLSPAGNAVQAMKVPPLTNFGTLSPATIMGRPGYFEARMKVDDQTKSFRLAYLVRADFAGRFGLSGAMLSDATRKARSADNMVTIKAE
jgi:uncharacterized protein YfaS (alpha-2-macroglobulin family)